MTNIGRPQSLTVSAWRIFELSIGEMLWSRRTIFMALVVGCPVLIAVAVRLVQAAGALSPTLRGVQVDGIGIFGTIIWILFLGFIVPVLGVFYGTSLIADEVEDKTITYLFTRPVRRAAVLLGKYIAYLVCAGCVVLPSVMVVYFLVVPFRQVASSFPSLLIDLGVLALGLASYGALFALVGALLKKPLVVGLVFVFGWEVVAMLVPGYVRRLTLAYYLQTLVPHAMPAGGIVSALQGSFFRGEAPGVASSILWLTAAAVVSLVLAARVVESREYVLEQ